MATYDPETLNAMRDGLDQAWTLLPEASKKGFLKVDMAERILQCAAAGERDLAGFRTAALAGTGAAQPPMPSGKSLGRFV
jgi:hypothetical protein